MELRGAEAIAKIEAMGGIKKICEMLKTSTNGGIVDFSLTTKSLVSSLNEENLNEHFLHF